MHPPTPVSLLARLRRPDDAAAWERFVHLYTPVLHAWACRAGSQPADAADLVQDVFLTLLREFPRFRYDSKGSFHAWLRTVTMNRWRDRMRARRPRPMDGVEPTLAPDPIDALIERQFREDLARRALRLMRSDFSEAAWRACWEMAVNGRPAAEVAGELGITVGAAHAARFRVLARLRQELSGILD